jgi:hypothetical protein
VVPGGEITVAVAPGALELPRAALFAWIQQSASAVAGYYGRFPADRTRLLVVPGSGRGVSSGRSWGYRGASVRIVIGAQATPLDLARDWILVHELTHLAFPSVPSRHHWIEEGLASYVEPVARAQAGQLAPEAVWAELAAGLPKGLPQPGDRGLDHTPTWGRTYWGGALFALLADVEIHRRTQNRAGLQEALRAILATGNMETSSPLEPLLDIGDRATGVPVLAELYGRMKDQPAPVDLDALWRELGVQIDGRARASTTAPRSPPPAVRSPRLGRSLRGEPPPGLTTSHPQEAPMTSPALVDRIQTVLAQLERAQWIPQLLTRLFIGYFFLETGWGKIHNLDAMAQRFAGWGIPFAAFNAALSGYTELIGGALILIGCSHGSPRSRSSSTWSWRS